MLLEGHNVLVPKWCQIGLSEVIFWRINLGEIYFEIKFEKTDLFKKKLLLSLLPSLLSFLPPFSSSEGQVTKAVIARSHPSNNNNLIFAFFFQFLAWARYMLIFMTCVG